MAVNAPQVYPTFVAVSGESEPTLGDRASTVAAAFGGDAASFTAVNPLDVLTTRRFPGTAGFLVAGQQDPQYLPQAQQLLGACRAAGMDVQLQILPGRHTRQVWGPGLTAALPWLGTRLGLTRCAADEILYVGDRLDNDIRPAVSRGLLTALIRRGPWGVIQEHDPEADRVPTFRITSLAELPDLVAEFNATSR